MLARYYGMDTLPAKACDARCMSSTSEFQRQPAVMEIRVIERDGKRVLQQCRNKPGGPAYDFTWVDVLELPKLASVLPLQPRKWQLLPPIRIARPCSNEFCLATPDHLLACSR